MSMEEDIERHGLMHRYLGASIALKGMWDSLAHIQVFTLPTLWPEGSSELDAVHDALEGVKAMIMMRETQISEAAERMIKDGDSGS